MKRVPENSDTARKSPVVNESLHTEMSHLRDKKGLKYTECKMMEDTDPQKPVGTETYSCL